MNILRYVQGESKLPLDTKLGVVYLKVKNLEDQVKFYQLVLKMTLHEKTDTYAILGDTEKPLLHLRKGDDFKRYHQTTGMYHFALLYPSEKELAKAIAWLFTIKYPNAPTDHGFSKTTYLKDLEGNDIELYIRTIDRAIYVENNGDYKIKYNDGRLTDGRDELDLDELFSNIDNTDELNSPIVNMEMGHIHLYGSNIQTMLDFYKDVIGFAEGVYMPAFKMADVGLSHEFNHVVAFNAWKQTNIAAPSDALGLDFYTIIIDNKEAFGLLLDRLKNANVEIIKENHDIFIYDPSNIKVKLHLNNK